MKTSFSEIIGDIFYEMKQSGLFHILNIIIHIALVLLMAYVSTLFVSFFNGFMNKVEAIEFVTRTQYLKDFIPILNEVVDYLIILLLCSTFITNLAFGTLDIINEGGISIYNLFSNLLQTFLKSFSTTLWMGVTLVPVTSICLLLITILEKMLTNQLVLIGIVIALIMLIVYQILKYTYVYFILADNVELTAIQVCHISKEMFKQSRTFLFSVTIIIVVIGLVLSKLNLGTIPIVIAIILLPLFINILLAKVYIMLK